MNLKIYSKLSAAVKQLVDSIEDYSKLEIAVEPNLTAYKANDVNPGAPVALILESGATFYLRNPDNFSEQGILHLLLLVKRYWIEKVPQIVPVAGDIRNFKITADIEVALERLVVVPLEVNYGFEPYGYWNETVPKNWEKYPFPEMNGWARRMNFLLSSLTTYNLVRDENTKSMVTRCFANEGFLPIAARFNKEIMSSINSKEACLSIVAEYLNIPKEDIGLRYFDVKNRRYKDVPFKSVRQSKPSGVTGMTTIKTQIGQQTQTFQRIPFPKGKESLELIIANAFLVTAAKNDMFSFQVKEISQNAQNHFDFQLETNVGKKFLELMEVAPLEKAHKYANAPSSYNPFEFGSYILNKIKGKSDKYIGVTKTGLILLMYTTDWRFISSTTLIALLQYWTLQDKLSFEYIYFYEPITDVEGITHLIFPTPVDHWSDFNPEDYKESQTQILSPFDWIQEPPQDLD